MAGGVQLMLDWSQVVSEGTYGKWITISKGDSISYLADKHYSRQTVGAK